VRTCWRGSVGCGLAACDVGGAVSTEQGGAGRASPYYWASFKVVGDTAKLPLAALSNSWMNSVGGPERSLVEPEEITIYIAGAEQTRSTPNHRWLSSAASRMRAAIPREANGDYILSMLS